ncbi:sugar ABC transporter substrate-binding protein [Paenibacillus filicis]|uniref:Sugar ABC transporter substrate-binding protein n=1 Tax=Paenibacillus gyeongsangnamensis TaxID=3388067 RepID=A0ABT4QH41_9BACL|nr:sugar ABC transporter substrate-binding protein [Paenibacillus filicis]MCZ8516199.1 sugar ABC transporter substrate-binding protein [Paenibacillus filicis]
MTKRMWTGLAASGLALSVLAGCGAGGGNSQQAAGGDAGKKGDVNLRLYTYGTESAYNWKKTLSAFEEKNPGIKVELVQLSEKGDTQEAMKKLDLAAASGETMDILMFSDPASYAQRIGLGMAAPLDDYIAKEGYKENEEYKVDTSLNGKVYSLPGKFNSWYVLLNKNQLDEAGLPVPKDWTWDQFAEYAKKLTKGDGASKRYGTYFHGPQGGGWTEYMKLMMENQPENADFLKADGTSNLDNPNFKKTLELRMKMEKEDKSAVPYADMISQKLNYRTQFYNQSASMILIGSWMNAELGGTDTMPLNFNLAVAPFPKNNASDPTGIAPVATDYVSVAAGSKHKDEAYKFVRWYTTEGQLVQGKNVPAWNKVKSEDVGKIIDTILSSTKNPEKVDKASLVATMTASKASQIVPTVSYQAEISKALNEEFEKMILGKQDVNATVKSSQDRVNQIIASNKK